MFWEAGRLAASSQNAKSYLQQQLDRHVTQLSCVLVSVRAYVRSYMHEYEYRIQDFWGVGPFVHLLICLYVGLNVCLPRGCVLL